MLDSGGEVPSDPNGDNNKKYMILLSRMCRGNLDSITGMFKNVFFLFESSHLEPDLEF